MKHSERVNMIISMFIIDLKKLKSAVEGRK